jgi:hypothetical protein
MEAASKAQYSTAHDDTKHQKIYSQNLMKSCQMFYQSIHQENFTQSNIEACPTNKLELEWFNTIHVLYLIGIIETTYKEPM